MALAVASLGVLLLGWGVGGAAVLPGSGPEGLLSQHDASGLVQVSVALDGRRAPRNGTGEASGSEAFWPPEQWQDDLTFLDPEQPSPEPKAKKQEQVSYPTHLETPTSRVLVLPEKKLAFCYIEKNACTQFNKLFNKMNRRSSGWFGMDNSPWTLSSAWRMGLDVAELTQSNGWKWAVFLRDPLLRYLSAWGSKCVMDEDRQHMNCLPPESPLHNASVEAFESNVRANFASQDVMAGNPHWAPQAAFCGGLRGTDGYDLVQVLRGDVNLKVREMLRMVNASEQYVDQFFPTRSVSGHHTRLNATDYYRQDEIRRKVEEIYAEDFRLPGVRV